MDKECQIDKQNPPMTIHQRKRAKGLKQIYLNIKQSAPDLIVLQVLECVAHDTDAHVD